MAGTKQGAKTAKKRYGQDWHRRLGLKGGNPMLLAVRDRKLAEGGKSPEPVGSAK